MNELRTAAQQALEALELGHAAADAEAQQYHAAMAGYRTERHAQMDAEVQQIAQAITALRTALAQPEGGGNLPPPLQPEPEPVAWYQEQGHEVITEPPEQWGRSDEPWVPLYTAPPQQPEPEPCAMRYGYDGYGYLYIDAGSGSDWRTRVKGAEPLYPAPPKRKPLTLTDLQEALVLTNLIDRDAIEDPDEYDEGSTLAQIDALHRIIKEDK